ncbi:MAG: hypothetical protein RML56_02725 [Burkholderiales bacterium]|nr:hypothetical protein [Burkholderiales bacterium]
MRTTLDVDDAVLKDLKRRQRREGKPLGRLVSGLLAVALAQEKRGGKTSAPQPFGWQCARDAGAHGPRRRGGAARGA